MILLFLSLTLTHLQQAPSPPPQGELRVAEQSARVSTALDQILVKDPNGALVTIDAEGRPRVRTVAVHVESQPLRFWIATRPTTRKLEQIRANPRVALYFSIDSEESYASVMGTGVIHDDEAKKQRVRWQTDDVLDELYPDFPDDYVLIEIIPSWIEVGGQGATYDDSTWRPEALLPRQLEGVGGEPE